ncbi:DUF2252 domain-containing protein [Pseudanabaena sp. UWO310]|uniref:DUF2252 domain-containing protein n=1 Tax=Pseudanabaena sp. UWO310 TaxID=2480795 RepID=UPI001157EDD3|nr:DUF2252 family protein [Pseudanabaena sp. UWO310]TYQ26761.1 DUF2252 domain-containing protein [Pseudanabaena sp. UWO310]
MAKRNIRARIEKFNLSQPRDPKLLEAKYAAMRSETENPFVFFRATCHLFYEDLPITSWFKKAPLTWICGDLHIENFGNYKASNRRVYFDVNDFDEAVLAPCTWEIARLLTSIFVATETFAIGQDLAEKLCQQIIDSYSQTVAKGKAYWMGDDTAPQVIKDMLSRKTEVKRKELLEERTELSKDKQKRSIKIDNKKALAVSDEQKQKVQGFMETFAAQQSNPQFFKLLDVAQRIAGKGSLGVERYVLLVEGKGSPDGNYLLDLKKSLPSSLAPYTTIWEQPKWANQADRIVSIQRRSQAITIAFLNTIVNGTDSFVLRELQSTLSPTDHLKITKWDDNLEESKELMRALGEVVAWSHLRSSGQQGSAIADELINFASKSKWKTEMMEYAKTYSQQVHKDWQEFRL